jgi:hypothetical protein
MSTAPHTVSVQVQEIDAGELWFFDFADDHQAAVKSAVIAEPPAAQVIGGVERVQKADFRLAEIFLVLFLFEVNEASEIASSSHHDWLLEPVVLARLSGARLFMHLCEMLTYRP